jgi:dolichol-phosphate mannosyltransferase
MTIAKCPLTLCDIFMRHLLGSKLIKFLLGGGLSAGVNLALIFLLIEQLGFNSPVLRNAANLIAIEIW